MFHPQRLLPSVSISYDHRESPPFAVIGEIYARLSIFYHVTRRHLPQKIEGRSHMVEITEYIALP